jgi:hypothetical protein
MLGRFIFPVDRIDEFESVMRRQHADCSKPSQRTWRLSALTTTNLEADLTVIEQFNRRHAASGGSAGPRLAIDTIELKGPLTEEIGRSLRRVADSVTAYVEVPVSTDEGVLGAAGESGARVKVRTGGVTPQAFPACVELAGFLGRCAAVRVPFKATAGLHHPIRSVQRLTYAEDSPQATMHGFVNVFLAASGVRAGMSVGDAERLLNETSPAAFQFEDQHVRWNQYRWTSDQLRAARCEFAASFGSCSFQEPVDDLKAIGWL